MRRVQILAITLLAVLVLLIGMGAVACNGNGDEGAPPPGDENGAPPPGDENGAAPGDENGAPPAVLPTPGVWVASIDIGELQFTINADSTMIVYCEVYLQKGIVSGCEWSGVSFEPQEGWPITDGRFTIALVLTGGVIQGEFDETGTYASGTWEMSVCGTIFSGTWEASAP